MIFLLEFSSSFPTHRFNGKRFWSNSNSCKNLRDSSELSRFDFTFVFPTEDRFGPPERVNLYRRDERSLGIARNPVGYLILVPLHEYTDEEVLEKFYHDRQDAHVCF